MPLVINFSTRNAVEVDILFFQLAKVMIPDNPHLPGFRESDGEKSHLQLSPQFV